MLLKCTVKELASNKMKAPYYHE